MAAPRHLEPTRVGDDGGAFLAAGLTGAAAIAIALASQGDRFWFLSLQRPAGAISDGAIALVWVAVFLAQGVAAAWLWRDAGPGSARALTLHALQLGVNALCTALLYRAERLDLATAGLALLWLLTGATALAFRRLSTRAAWLVLPALVWTGYVAVVVLRLWQLNG